MKNPPNAGLIRLIWPPGESDAPQTKIGVPRRIGWGRAHSILLRPCKNRNAQSSKWFGLGWICMLLQVPTSTTRPNTFHFWNRVPFHFFWPKKPKVDLKAPFSFSKNSNIFNDLLAGAYEQISENFFLQIFENFWNFFILKKEFDSPLSYNCNLYLKPIC